MQALDYSPPPSSRRPGILTALAIVSIVIGALSVLTGCWSAASTVILASVSASGLEGMREPATIALNTVDAFLRVGLAALLITAGVFVLRDHRLGRTLHMTWAGAKIPAALFGGFAYWHMMSRMLAGPLATPGGPPPNVFLLAGPAIQVGIACLYPIAVLIVLRTRGVRNYYAAAFGASQTGTAGR